MQTVSHEVLARKIYRETLRLLSVACALNVQLICNAALSHFSVFIVGFMLVVCTRVKSRGIHML